MIIFDWGTGNINGPGLDIQHEWELLLDEWVLILSWIDLTHYPLLSSITYLLLKRPIVIDNGDRKWFVSYSC